MILENTPPINQYIAVGNQSSFVFTFLIFSTTDILVYVNDELNTIGNDYSVKNTNGDTIFEFPVVGGNVVFNTPLKDGDRVTLLRNIPAERLSYYATSGDFRANVINAELTKLFAIQQQILHDLSRTFRLSDSDSVKGSLKLPTDRASKFLAFDENSNMIASAGTMQGSPLPITDFMKSLLDASNAEEAKQILQHSYVKNTRFVVEQTDKGVTSQIEIRSQNNDKIVNDDNGSWFARTIYSARNSENVGKHYASIDGYIHNANAGNETGYLRVHTRQKGAYNKELDIGNGMHMRGVTGGSKGAGTINAKKLFIEGKEVTSVPVGTIVLFGGYHCPNGYVYCGGAAISRTTYADLFEAIGTIYGAGNGKTTFNVPDMRGVFSRGADNGRGLDPGRALGSYQADEFKRHNHSVASRTNFAGDLSGNESIHLDRGVGWGHMVNANFEYELGGSSREAYIGRTSNTGGRETKPKNLALHYIIKY